MSHLLTCLAADAAEADAIQAALDERPGASLCATVQQLDLAPDADAPRGRHLLLAAVRSSAGLERALGHAIERARPEAWPVALHLLDDGDAPLACDTTGGLPAELPAELLPLGRHALEERLALLVEMRVRHVTLVTRTPTDLALACRVAQRCALLVAGPDAIDHCLAYYRISGWLAFEASPAAGGLTVSA